MIGNRIQVENSLDIESKIIKIMEHKAYKKNFNLELFTSSQSALYSEISLSTCSEKVMAIVLRVQERSYEKSAKKSDNFYLMVLYSALYKYLYLDFTENEIDDFHLLRYNLTNFYEHVKTLKEIKDEIYLDLTNNHNWKKLKN